MKAAVCHEFGAPLVVEDIQIGDAGQGAVKVKISACAICHSDIIYADGAWGGTLPAVYGHEAAGVVEQIGPGVTHVSVGDHVVVTLLRSCGECHYCSMGHQSICEGSVPIDAEPPLTRSDGADLHQGLRTGAFAEHVVVDGSQVCAIPKDVPMDSASLLACGVMTGLGAVWNTAEVPSGSHVVVIGTGGVGLNSVQGAALRGARTVIAMDLSDEKMEAAKKFGATHTVNAAANDAAEQVKALTDGRGADYVFVTVGAVPAIEQSFHLLAPAGTTVLVGMPGSDAIAKFDPDAVANAAQRVMGSKMGSCKVRVDIPRLVDLYQQGRLKLDELITGRYPLEQINEAIAEVKSGEALRNVIVFD